MLSQFGHIFAPRPAVAVREMLRVLKPGGRIAFSTWPPEHFTGRMFAFIARLFAAAAGRNGAGALRRSCGAIPNIVRERLGAAVTDLKFDRETLVGAALSVAHFRNAQENTIGPLTKLVASLAGRSGRLARIARRFRHDRRATLIRNDNTVRMPFLMARATKV